MDLRAEWSNHGSKKSLPTSKHQKNLVTESKLTKDQAAMTFY